MEKTEINEEAFERFHLNHLQEIRAVCELTEWSIKRGLDNNSIQGNFDDVELWQVADDITQNAIGILQAFGGKCITNAEYYILEGIVYDTADKYLKRQGVVLD